jgi:hypothetical protein
MVVPLIYELKYSLNLNVIYETLKITMDIIHYFRHKSTVLDPLQLKLYYNFKNNKY